MAANSKAWYTDTATKKKFHLTKLGFDALPDSAKKTLKPARPVKVPNVIKSKDSESEK